MAFGAENVERKTHMNDQMTQQSQVAPAPVELVVRDNGRRVAVHRLADGDTGRTLVLCHIAPGAGNFDPEPEATKGRKVTLLAPDRPGYGQSDPVSETAWASVGAAADDVAAVLDRRAPGPVAVAGWSAGGRVALALAARRPGLVDRVVVLCTPAPHEQVPWIPPEQYAALESLRGLAPYAARAALSQQLAQLIPGDASAADRLSLLGTSDADDTA